MPRPFKHHFFGLAENVAGGLGAALSCVISASISNNRCSSPWDAAAAVSAIAMRGIAEAPASTVRRVVCRGFIGNSH
jgi:hypothetical protein